MARPSTYDPIEHPRLARLYYSQCRTKFQLAKHLGIAHQTITRWCVEHPEFRVAFKLGRMDASHRVERALFERAVGYAHAVEKVVVIGGGMHDTGRVETVEYTERLPPDVGAIKLWLTNRKPRRWQEKQKVEHEGRMTLEQLVAAVEKTGNAPAEQQPEGPNSG